MRNLCIRLPHMYAGFRIWPLQVGFSFHFVCFNYLFLFRIVMTCLLISLSFIHSSCFLYVLFYLNTVVLFQICSPVFISEKPDVCHLNMGM